VVPKVTVIITNDATGVSETTTTDELGRYIFNGLPPAAYTVKVEAAGFKTIVRSNIVLRVNQQTDVGFTLELDEISETVQVTTESPLLRAAAAAQGRTRLRH
jgi:hypothetical protein